MYIHRDIINVFFFKSTLFEIVLTCIFTSNKFVNLQQFEPVSIAEAHN